MIGAADLADGTKIVTYNHRPLYRFSGDSQPGDTNGQGSGGVWFVITPTGAPVGAPAQPAATTQPTAAAQPTLAAKPTATKKPGGYYP